MYRNKSINESYAVNYRNKSINVYYVNYRNKSINESMLLCKCTETSL